ncbi:MAG: hypothetical protein HY051_03595 [Candidatus Aenigmarchaeota archaeon]|nr:hypothetical protein [Candidatus Aenigmarchaeota archaeon]
MASDILAAAFVTGIIVKLTDQMEDKNKKSNSMKNIPAFLGTVYGVLISYVMLKSPVVANLWMAAVLGNILAGNMDVKGHRIGIFTMLSVLAVFGFPKFESYLLLVFTVAAYFDEFLKDLGESGKIKSTIFNRIVEYRLILEATAFAVSLYTAQWILFASIFLFDLGYIIVNELTKRH